MHYLDLNKWPILSFLKHDFLSEIHMVMVYGKGDAAVIILKNKKVYILDATTDDNDRSLESVNVKKSIVSLKELKVLSRKDIQTFACGSDHVLALTKNGEVYSWGSNTHGQLGLSESVNNRLRPSNIQYFRKTTTLKGKCTTNPSLIEMPTAKDGMRKYVVDIACGSFHSLAVTKEGEVFAWGQSNCGQVADNSHYKTPTQITVGEKMIVQVACGNSFNMVLTDNGEVYGWGDNSVGQIGKNTRSANQYVDYYNCEIRDTQLFPVKIDSLLGIIIVKVVCGFNHVLALTDTGKLYAWGGNNHGQLGIGNKNDTCKPCMVTHEMGRVSDIAALHSGHISIAVGENKYVYMWGKCLGQDIVEPTLTSFSTIHDALFACFDTRIMHKPLILHKDEEPNIPESDIYKCLRKAFNDESTSDLTIQVGNQSIYVHKTILKIRCPYFNNMFQHNWSENKQSVLEYNEFSYTVVKAFLEYLYTGVVDVPTEKAVELLTLADKCCENDLKRRCVLLIKQEINVTNVIYLYRAAIDYNVKELEEFCLSFASNNLKTVLQSEDFYKYLNEITLVQRFMDKMCSADAIKP